MARTLEGKYVRGRRRRGEPSERRWDRGGGGLATKVKHKRRQARANERSFGPEEGFYAAAAEVNQVSSTRTTRPVNFSVLAQNDQISLVATGGDCDDSRTALEDENLLATVKVEDCIFEMGDCQKIAERYPLKEGAVMVADTGGYAGMVMQLHDDGIGANFWVDKRVNQWSTRRMSRRKQNHDEINELESSDGVPKVRLSEISSITKVSVLRSGCISRMATVPTNRTNARAEETVYTNGGTNAHVSRPLP